LGTEFQNKRGKPKMNKIFTLKIVSFTLLFFCSSTFAQKELHKTFSGIKSLEISTVSGDCEIIASSSKDVKVDLEYKVKPAKNFEPILNKSGNKLKIEEDWSGSASGSVKWRLTVPAEMDIEFSSASGDLSIDGGIFNIETETASGDISLDGCNGDFRISTASGDITINDAEGELDLSTASGDVKGSKLRGDIELSSASGDVKLRDSKGYFDLSAASGDVKVSDAILSGASEFSTASGDVSVSLAKSSEFDIEVSSASGDANLDYNGNQVKGYFELTARKKRGKIKSSFEFDNEKEFEKNDQTYIRKSFTKGSKTPKIYISTASGTASLKK